MSNVSTIILAPFLVAFLMFVFRFYGRENAASKLGPSFLLAFATVVVVCLYLVLGVTRTLPEYGTIGFGIVGVALLALSLYRLVTL
jgi:hypothetical protein